VVLSTVSPLPPIELDAVFRPPPGDTGFLPRNLPRVCDDDGVSLEVLDDCDCDGADRNLPLTFGGILMFLV